MPTIRRTMMHRQITGAMFGETARLIRGSVTSDAAGRDARGRPIKSVAPSPTAGVPIKVATNPIGSGSSPSRNALVAKLIEDGTRIEDLREFFTVEDLDPKRRDAIFYEGETYIIITTARYGGHSESVGSKVEPGGDVAPPVTPPSEPQEDKIMYLFQTNLSPNGAQLTRAGSPGDGTAERRLAEWKMGTRSAAASGFNEITLFSQNTIAPQHGRDLIATSPFITNYEGHVTMLINGYDTSGIVSWNTIYYVKTTHFIPGQSPNIVSVRAFKKDSVVLGSTFSVNVPLVEFNSMVRLANDRANGGTIGLQLDLGVAACTNLNNAQCDELVSELNTGQSPTSHTPVTGYNYGISGFNTRVTFLQYELSA